MARVVADGLHGEAGMKGWMRAVCFDAKISASSSTQNSTTL